MFWSAQYATPHLIAIASGLLMLVVARIWPRLGRALFVALFAWACAINWRTAHDTPQVYLEYGDLAVVDFVGDFIRGPFASHITLMVSVIATCQGLIAVGIFWGGWPARIALLGALTFLLAITPLGVGSGFPSTVLMAVGGYRLLRSPRALERNLGAVATQIVRPSTSLWARLLLLAGVSAGFALVYAYGVRPWFLRWGATDAELQAVLPGDTIVPVARQDVTATRAIEIAAAPAQVWPWIAQLGQDRGGFYSYEVLENLVGCQMQNTDRIHPEYQHWKRGDKLWMYPPGRLDGIGHALLVDYQPGRALGFATRQTGTGLEQPYDGSWSFVLQPRGDNATRLLVRGRAGGERALLWAGFDHIVFEPMHFIMERKMMTNIKRLAEGGRSTALTDNAQPVLWVAALILMVASAVLVLRRTRWAPPLLAFAVAASAFQLLTLCQPPLAIGATLVIVTAALLWRPGQRSVDSTAALELGKHVEGT